MIKIEIKHPIANIQQYKIKKFRRPKKIRKENRMFRKESQSKETKRKEKEK